MQILLIIPNTQILLEPPKFCVKYVPFLVIGRVRSSRSNEKVWGDLDHTWGTEAVGVVVVSTKYRDLCRVAIASRIVIGAPCKCVYMFMKNILFLHFNTLCIPVSMASWRSLLSLLSSHCMATVMLSGFLSIKNFLSSEMKSCVGIFLYSTVICDLYSTVICDLYSTVICDLYSTVICDLYSTVICDLFM